MIGGNMKRQYDRPEVIIYLNTVKTITASGLREFCKMSKQTANDVIKRYVAQGFILPDGSMKTKTKSIPKYKLSMSIPTYDKIVNQFLIELKEKMTQNHSDLLDLSEQKVSQASPNQCHSDLVRPTPSEASPNEDLSAAKVSEASPNSIDLRSKDLKDLKDLKDQRSKDPSVDSDLLKAFNDSVKEAERLRVNPMALFDEVFKS